MNNYGLIGKNIKYSFSPLIHQSLFSEFKIQEAQYNLIELQTIETLTLAELKKYQGLNVTIPYKRTIIEHLKKLTANSNLELELSQDVLTLNSCNTITVLANKIVLSNTDFLAFKEFVKVKKLVLEIDKVAILGTGQTALMCQKYLEDSFKNLEIKLVSRTKNKTTLTYQELEGFLPNLIINTTPVGQGKLRGENLVSSAVLSRTKKILDFNYSPPKTKLLLAGEKNGAEVFSGLDILILQAMKSFFLWHELKLEVNHFQLLKQKILEQIQVRFDENIIVYGMPLAGKSTYAKQWINNKIRTIYDLDAEILKTINIQEYIETNGIESFRIIEGEILEKLIQKREKKVIFVGGGTLTNCKNIEKVGLATLVYLNPKVEDLIDRLTREQIAKRPLLGSKETYQKLYNERYLGYQKIADYDFERLPQKFKEFNENINN